MPAAPVEEPSAESIEELLSLEDEAFVRCAYRTILGRAVDDGGLANYLGQVRQGFAKGQIVVELALSEEGRSSSPAVPGLAALIEQHRPQKPCRWCRFIRRAISEAIGPLERQLRTIENRLYRLQTASDAHAARTGQEMAKLERAFAHSRVPAGTFRATAALGTEAAAELPSIVSAAIDFDDLAPDALMRRIEERVSQSREAAMLRVLVAAAGHHTKPPVH